jgi:hypothetical protein
LSNSDGAFNIRLSTSLLLAAEGTEGYIRSFFEELLSSDLIVPNRYQHYPLTDQPSYPNDFVQILGVQDKERVVVPCFLEPSHVTEWSGTPFSYRSYKGSKLLELMPEDWWLVVGLGQNVSKEISPWEINSLRGGSEGIDAVVREHILDEMEDISTLDIQTLSDETLKTFLPLLESTFNQHEEIAQLYMGAIPASIEHDAPHITQYVVGLAIPGQPIEIHEQLRDSCNIGLSAATIGDIPIRVITGDSVERSLSLSLFLHHQPVFSRNE